MRVASLTTRTVHNYTKPLRNLVEYHHAEAEAITEDEVLSFLAEREESIS